MLFWLISLPGLFLTMLFFEGQCAAIFPIFPQMLLVVIGLPLVAAFWAWVRARRSLQQPLFRGLVADVPAAAVVLIVMGAAAYTGLKWYAVHQIRKADERWAAIGHPMDKFEAQMKPVQENKSYHALVQDLRPFGVQNLYKIGTRKASRAPYDTIDCPEHEIIAAMLEERNSPGDAAVPLPQKVAAYLDHHSEALSMSYQNILRRERPVWECNVSDGWDVSVPNFVSLRRISQLMEVDAFRCFAKNDPAGAAAAVNAGLRMTASIGHEPLIISEMAHVALSSLFAPALARLPEEHEPWAELSRQIDSKRRQFREVLQVHAWMLERRTQHCPVYELPVAFTRFVYENHAFPLWLSNFLAENLGSTLVQIEAAKASLTSADVVEISEHFQDALQTDLKAGEMDAAWKRYRAELSPCYSLYWQRINLALLLREQAEVIRFARAQMHDGKLRSAMEHDSLVVPGSKWLVTPDTTTNSVTLKLSPQPKWTSRSSYFQNSFLLPLDGSQSWKFASASSGGAAR